LGLLAAASEEAMWNLLKRLAPYSAILSIITLPRGDHMVKPRFYLGAIHETFVLTLAVGWAINLMFAPETIFNHPLRRGKYLNPCFGVDYPPASIVATLMFNVNIYWAWRLAWLESTRTFLMDEYDKNTTWTSRFATLGIYHVAVAFTCVPLLFTIGPQYGSWDIHIALFLWAAFSSYLAALGNYLEVYMESKKKEEELNPFYKKKENKLQRKHTIYMVTYSLSMLKFLGLYGVHGYVDASPRPTSTCDIECVEKNDWVQWYVKMIVEAVWLLHMLIEHSFAPPEPPMQETLVLKLNAVDMDHSEVNIISSLTVGAAQGAADLVKSVKSTTTEEEAFLPSSVPAR
jgi:hypothetical protein